MEPKLLTNYEKELREFLKQANIKLRMKKQPKKVQRALETDMEQINAYVIQAVT